MNGYYESAYVLGYWKCKKIILNRSNNEVNLDSNDSIGLTKKLKLLMLNIQSIAFTDDGKRVDYNKARISVYFQEYLELVYQLKHTQISSLNVTQKKSFFINIYNCLVIHGFINNLMDTFPGGLLSRLKFYATVSYIIDGIPYSLNDIENGILRHNRKSPTPWSTNQFHHESDKRLSYILECDPRIHFTLNCGAVSCPPISVYSDIEQELDEQLNLATYNYIAETSDIDLDLGVVKLSKLFDWYREDFGGSSESVLNWIKSNCSSDVLHKIETLEKNVHSRIENKDKTIVIEYQQYNWDVNSSS